jgi:hypothetical protein
MRGITLFESARGGEGNFEEGKKKRMSDEYQRERERAIYGGS